MNGIDGTPMTGAQWATHHVAVWLENDRPLAEEAREIAKGDKFEFGDRELSVWVSDILYARDDAQHVADIGADPRAALAVRDSFTREDFDGIDWRAVRESLLAE